MKFYRMLRHRTLGNLNFVYVAWQTYPDITLRHHCIYWVRFYLSPMPMKQILCNFHRIIDLKRYSFVCVFVFVSDLLFKFIHIKTIADSDQANNNSLIAHIANLPGFDASKARFVKQYSTRASPEKSALEIVPTAAELMLPWRRDRSYHSLMGTFLPI